MKIRRTPFIEQMQQTECGLACVAMIAGHYQAHYTLSELREFMEIGRDGSSLFHLTMLAEKIGFSCKSYKMTPEKLSLITLPAIAHWEGNHFVVVDKINKNHVYYIDPNIGRKKVTLETFAESFSNVVLEMKPTPELTPKKPRPVWRPFMKHLSSCKMLLWKILLISLILQLVTLAIPLMSQYLIDELLTVDASNFLTVFLLGIIGVTFTQSIFEYIRGRHVITLNNTLDYNMMKSFFSHLLELPYQFFQTRSFGDIMFRANSIRAVRDILADQIIKGILELITMTVILIYLFSKSVNLAFIVILFSTINVAVTALTRSRIKELNQEEISKNAQLQGFQTEFVYGIFGIKTAGIEDQTYEKWSSYLREFISSIKRKDRFLNIVNSMNSTFTIIFPLFILWLGARFVLTGSLSMGELVAFHGLAIQFFGNSTTIVQTFNSFFLTTSYLQRIQDVLSEPQEQTNENEYIEQLEGDIKLKNVDFKYTKYSSEVIKDVSLHIKPGEKVAIVGKSGAGKSTLAKLMLGLYIPTRGTVAFDDKEIRNINLKRLRRKVGVVPQDVTLFNRTIKDNISLYSDDVKQETIEQVAKMAQIHDDIMAMPMKYNTMISELGMNISGGQRQRIALSRALVNKPSIILLDEATSSLDHFNERQIDHYLNSLKCTRIVIAHKLTSIMGADQIIVMEDGRIKDVGVHDELVQRDEFYSTFYKKFHQTV